MSRPWRNLTVRTLWPAELKVFPRRSTRKSSMWILAFPSAPRPQGFQSQAEALHPASLFLHPLAEVASVAEEVREEEVEVEVEVVIRLLLRSREPFSWCFPEPGSFSLAIVKANGGRTRMAAV